MLDAMRQAATGWVAKVLLGLLALSFVAWGISGRVPGYGSGEVAMVGNVPVTAREFSIRLEERMRALGRQLQRGFSMEQANALGLPESVLQELVARAALRDQALQYNLGVSDERVAQAISDDPSFQVDGRFNRENFRYLLRNLNMTEAQYVEELRSQIVTNQIASAITGDIAPPQLLTKALYKYRTETRTFSHVTVGASAIDPVGEPDDATIAKYFEQNKARYQAPEYRKLGYIALTSDSIKNTSAVTEEDIAADYARLKDKEYTTPERRQFNQIRYASKEEAEAAAKLLAEGKAFEDLLAARNMTLEASDIGLKTRPEIIDPDIAAAVFDAQLNAVIPVIDASLGPAIVRVGRIEQATVTPLDEVKDKIRQKLADRASRDQIGQLYDEIENERGVGAKLEDVASTLGLKYEIVEAIARDGSVPRNAPAPGIPGQSEVLSDAFQSDIDVENNPVRIGNNRYIFYEVLAITEARPLTAEEARLDVIADWKREETTARVGERATALFERLKAGASLEDIAAEIGAEVRKSENVRRAGTPEGLSRNAVDQGFAGQDGHLANADGAVAPDRILLRVDQVSIPAFLAETEDAQAITSQLESSLQVDLLQAYQTKLLDTAGGDRSTTRWSSIRSPERNAIKLMHVEPSFDDIQGRELDASKGSTSFNSARL